MIPRHYQLPMLSRVVMRSLVLAHLLMLTSATHTVASAAERVHACDKLRHSDHLAHLSCVLRAMLDYVDSRTNSSNPLPPPGPALAADQAPFFWATPAGSNAAPASSGGGGNGDTVIALSFAAVGVALVWAVVYASSRRRASASTDVAAEPAPQHSENVAI